jgi:hypothetical protein
MAGVPDCDKYIQAELLEAGIEIRSGAENWKYTPPKTRNNGLVVVANWNDYMETWECKGEVPYHIIGVLGDTTFKRAWYYWMVKCMVPLEVAEKMYEDPIGKKDVRVSGHCGCPPPNEWCKDIDGKKYITSYHIDSQEGLNLFVKTIKEASPK